jgi:hypothetical protein
VTPKRKPGGHPAKADPRVDRLFRTMRATVELVQELDGKLSPDGMLQLKAAALGQMGAYAELTGLPVPNQILGGTT